MTVDCPTPRKVCYRSRKAAKLGRRRVPKLRSGRTVRPYLCPCGSWHLGNLPPAVVRTSRAEFFDGVKPQRARRPKPVAPPVPVTPLQIDGAQVVSAHVWFQMRLCSERGCAHEEPCPEHGERRAA